MPKVRNPFLYSKVSYERSRQDETESISAQSTQPIMMIKIFFWNIKIFF